MWDAILSSGANVIIWCYHVMLSSGMITPPFFIFLKTSLTRKQVKTGAFTVFTHLWAFLSKKVIFWFAHICILNPYNKDVSTVLTRNCPRNTPVIYCRLRTKQQLAIQIMTNILKTSLSFLQNRKHHWYKKFYLHRLCILEHTYALASLVKKVWIHAVSNTAA